MAQEVHLSRIPADLAAGLLAGCEALDPAGLTTPDTLRDMTARGACFAATAPGAQAVYVVKVDNGRAWVSACKGTGPVDWSGLLLPIIEQQAQGLRAVAFQTARRGLVRKAKRQGYRVAGYILEKHLQ